MRITGEVGKLWRIYGGIWFRLTTIILCRSPSNSQNGHADRYALPDNANRTGTGS
jgi:hypothetical protein